MSACNNLPTCLKFAALRHADILSSIAVESAVRFFFLFLACSVDFVSFAYANIILIRRLDIYYRIYCDFFLL